MSERERGCVETDRQTDRQRHRERGTHRHTERDTHTQSVFLLTKK